MPVERKNFMLVQFSTQPPKITLNPDGNEPADVCIANISPAERRKRQQFGVSQIIFGVLIFAALLLFGVDKVWRLPLFFVFSAGASSIFQALDKT
jgi:hypothetical protein